MKRLGTNTFLKEKKEEKTENGCDWKYDFLPQLTPAVKVCTNQ